MQKSTDTNSNGEENNKPESLFYRNRTLYIVLIALFTALTFVATLFFNIPAAVIFGANGNINLGDSIIFVASILLGPLGGAVAGGLGAAGADLAGSYVQYAVFTLIIKSAAGFACGFVFRLIHGKHKKLLHRILAILPAALIIVVGYFFAEIILSAIVGVEDDTAVIILGLRTIVPNLIQVSVSALVAMIVLPRASVLFSDNKS